jgi:hypothetical protein
MESRKKGAWSYLDPLLLDLRQGEGRFDSMRWPRTKKRAIFLHVASLSFHYGPEVGASRHSLIWFRDLGAKSIGGPEGAQLNCDARAQINITVTTQWNLDN